MRPRTCSAVFSGLNGLYFLPRVVSSIQASSGGPRALRGRPGKNISEGDALVVHRMTRPHPPGRLGGL